jgi:hypothetical protein
MELKMYLAKAEWANSLIKEKDLLFVEFPNCISTTTGQPFKWLPTYEQLDQIKALLDVVEKQWTKLKETKNVRK